MGVFEKIFGTRSQREIKKIQPTVDKILALEDDYKALSEEALKAKTAEFKNRLDQGETLDDLPAGSLCCRSGSGRPGAGNAPLSCPAHRRHCAPSGAHRRNEDR